MKIKLFSILFFCITYQGYAQRLRPIIMTTFAMILGMLPLALSQSPGSELKNGMAWIIIGGLTSSFFLTLLIVPCVYMVVDNLKTKFSHNKQHE